MPYIVPNLTSKVLRGEMPEIVEVPHDPYRGWLEPEYPTRQRAGEAIWCMADACRVAYPDNPKAEDVDNVCCLATGIR